MQVGGEPLEAGYGPGHAQHRARARQQTPCSLGTRPGPASLSHKRVRTLALSAALACSCLRGRALCSKKLRIEVRGEPSSDMTQKTGH